MIKSVNLFKIFFLTVLFCSFGAGNAAADDVLETVYERAVDLMVNLKPVIFVLAGFGLVGFAWMAIFNQISWKWFSNIAIGLFLVANMGLFVDTFTNLGKGTESHLKAKYNEQYKIIYEDTLNRNGSYKATEGSKENPSSQEAKDNTGTGGQSSSDELQNYKQGEGDGSGSGQGPLAPVDNPDNEKQDCAAGTIWSSEKKTCISVFENNPVSDWVNANAPGTSDPIKECEAKGGQWIYPTNSCSI